MGGLREREQSRRIPGLGLRTLEGSFSSTAVRKLQTKQTGERDGKSVISFERVNSERAPRLPSGGVR